MSASGTGSAPSPRGSSWNGSVARDMFVIARRELRERVRSKWFVAMTLLGPIFMIAVIVIPALIASRGASGNKVQIVDHTQVLGEPLAAELKTLAWVPEVVPADTPEAELRRRIRTEEINGFIEIPADALESGTVVYRGDNASSQLVSAQIYVKLQKVIQRARGDQLKIDPTALGKVLGDVGFSARHTTGESDEDSSGMGAFALAYALALILYMVITVYGVAVMRSVVVEKTSRVMELLVAAVKPSALMGGKILGVAAAGLIQISVWLAMGAITLAYREQILGAFGVSGGSSLPPLAFTEIAVVLVYFIIGFIFYAAMYAAVGAMVSSDEESQQVQLPVTMILVIGVVCLQVISNDPRGTASSVMTQIPFWSPIVMPMRYALGGASGLEVLISLGILVVSTVLIIRLAAKIYRVGVLMYGKRPSLGELVRWLRY